MRLTFLKNFRNDEQGGILAFYVVMFMMMMVGGGMSIDFIRHEIKREALQDTLDRAVLAATGGAQAANAITNAEITAAKAAAVATVHSYVTVAGFDPIANGITVNPTINANLQKVVASSNFSVDTFFLRLSGIDVLNGVASSGASVSVSNIEMSLVLDISGSMDEDVFNAVGIRLGRRIELLQAAAESFSATMLSGDRATYTSISVVPFSGQVAIGNSLANEYPNFGLQDANTGSRNPWHNYSNCMEFNATDYQTTSFGPSEARNQYEHFQLTGGRSNGRPDVRVPWCPESNVNILPLANDLDTIKAMLNGLTPQGATNTWTGIKWGTALLDSSTQPIVDNLTKKCSTGTCEVDPNFSNRPSAFSDEFTLKFLIVMADGANTAEIKLPPNVYNAWQSSEAYTQQNADYWDPYYSDGVVWDANGDYFPGVRRTTGAQGDVRMAAMCNAAKNAGITIYTIGTDILPGSNADTRMRNCASSGNYYAVRGANIASAFNNIANSIQKLRLVN